MACSSAAWVLGGVRLTSSASTRLANTGPGMKRKARRPVEWSSSSTSVPVMSDGIRSGVNCTRLNDRFSTSARVEMSSVLARPGTPTNRQWPRANSATSRASTTSRWPTMRFSISRTISPRATAISRTDSSSDSASSSSGGLLTMVGVGVATSSTTPTGDVGSSGSSASTPPAPSTAFSCLLMFRGTSGLLAGGQALASACLAGSAGIVSRGEDLREATVDRGVEG